MPRILLADDSTHATRMGSKILTAEGIEVVTASNGEAALKKLGESEVDLVLADVYMPGLDGYEVCQWVKKSAEHSYIPVVLVVGALELYEPDKIAQVQADGLLKKPFEATAMMDTLRPLMDVASKAREKKKPKKAPIADAEEERTVRLGSSPIPAEESIFTPAPPEVTEVPPEMGDIPYGMDMSQEPAPAASPEIDLASVEFAMPSVEQTEGAEVTIPTEFQDSAPPTPAAPEPVAEAAPAESVYGVEPSFEAPVETPIEAAAEAPVEAAPPEPPAPEPEPPAPPPPPPPVETPPHWVAEPAEVTKQDQALFEPAVAAAPAAKETPPDWNELLKSVEEPAAAAAAPVLAKEEAPAPPAPAPTKVDEDAVRTAVHLCLENALPTLVEDITASIIRRLNK